MEEEYYKLDNSQIAVIVLAGIVGIFFAGEIKISEAREVIFPVNRRTAVFLLCLLVGLLFSLPLLRQAVGGEWLGIFDSFFRIGSLVFGGGHVVLPMLEKEMVPSGWVDSSHFLMGYGLAQAVPGPLFTFAAYFRYRYPWLGWRNGGNRGHLSPLFFIGLGCYALLE